MKKKIKNLLSLMCCHLHIKESIAANYLISIFEDNLFFQLSQKTQLIIIDNLINYFEILVMGIEKSINGQYYVLKTKSNKCLTKKEIFKYLVDKVKYLSQYNYTLI